MAPGYEPVEDQVMSPSMEGGGEILITPAVAEGPSGDWRLEEEEDLNGERTSLSRLSNEPSVSSGLHPKPQARSTKR